MNRSQLASSFLGFVLIFITGAAAEMETTVPSLSEDRLFRTPVEDREWRHPCVIPPLAIPQDSPVLALRKTEVHARILGTIADVEVIQHYHNPSATTVDVGYTFPLPADAAVRSVELVTGDRTLAADLKEVDEAREIYEEARRAGNGALLVESRRENVFRARIANVEPGSELAVRIRYSQALSPEGSSFRLLFPTVVAPRYCPAGQEDAGLFDLPYVPTGLPGHSIEIDVELDAGIPVDHVVSPSHPISVSIREGVTRVALGKVNEVPNRDFILSWNIVSSGAQSTGATLWTGPRDDFGIPFLMVAWPPRPVGETKASREIIFILDSSGSMSGAKFEAATRALRGFLRGLGNRDTIRLIDFDDEFSEMNRKALPFSQAMLDRADAWIASLVADGGTEILKPLSHALGLPRDEERERIIVLLTDGQVGNEDEVLSEVTRRAGRTRIYTMGIDYAVNDGMLRSIARATHGSCILISPDEDVEGAILSLKRKFTSPVATDISLDMKGAEKVFPDPAPDLHAGEPLVLTGRTTAREVEGARLTGRFAGKPWNADLEVKSVPAKGVNIAAVAAEKEIESLTDRMSNGDRDELKKRIVDLSLAHGVASAFTAFVVVDRRAEKTETGSVRSVEVPVAFPQGWNWNTVYGGGRRNGVHISGYINTGYVGASYAPSSGMIAYAPSPKAMHGAFASAPADAMCSASGVSAPDAAPQPGVSIEDMALRFLTRKQRASGMWLRNGRENARVTALSLLALLPSHAKHQNECERAIGALLKDETLREIQGGDHQDRALVKLALSRAADELQSEDASLADAARKAAAKLGQMTPSPDVSILDRLASSDRPDDLADLLLAAIQSPNGAEQPRRVAVARLEAKVSTSGADAGGVQISGVDGVEATALYAALAMAVR